MSYINYFPIPSDRMGAMWTLESIKDLYIVEFGPAGTTHFAIEGLMNLNGDSHANVITTHISEHDLTFGDTTRLEKAIKELDEQKKPKYIFVFSSSLASIIGIDIASVCFELENEVNAKLIPVDTGGFSGDFTLGVKNMLFEISKHMVKPPTQKRDVYNIIGGQMDEYNHRSDIKEIKRMMKTYFNMTCQTVFSLGGCVESIEKASEAKFNIVIRSEGIKAAKHLESVYGTPYVLSRPYGYQDTLSFIETIEQITDVSANDQGEMDVLRSTVGQLQRHDAMCRVMISGNVDAVNGMMKLLDELQLGQLKGVVGHKKPIKAIDELDERIVFTKSEKEKLDILETFKPDIILGDGVMENYAKDNNISYFQVANPNLERIKLYDGTPFMGVNGGMYLSEVLQNLIKSFQYKQ